MADTYSMVAGPTSRVKKLRKDVGSGLFADAVVAVNAAGVAIGGGAHFIYRPTIVVDTAAYAQYDGVGGIISLTNFVEVSGGKALIKDIVLTELGAQTPGLTFTFFKATPAGGTYTDNAALAVDATDIADETGVPVSVVQGDWSRVNSSGHRKAALQFPEFVVECAVTTLFMLIQVDSASYDAVATGDLVMRIGGQKLG